MKAKTGRPTKYKSEYCDMIIEHMAGEEVSGEA